MTQNLNDAVKEAFDLIHDGERRVWLLKARTLSDVDFIVNATAEFWSWLAKVKWCSHLHIDLDGESTASMPRYHCRYCGAVLACRCSTAKGGNLALLSPTCHPRRWRDEIPFAPFADIFIRSRLCPHCRMELSLRKTHCGYAFPDALAAIRLGDIYLALKMLQELWQREPKVMKEHKREIKAAFKDAATEWAIHEYGLFCEGGYTGFQRELEPDNGLCQWFYDVINPDDPDALLKRGSVITNIVGMAHVAQNVSLNLHGLFHSETVVLEREPENVYDKDAVVVVHGRIGLLGYIKRTLAAWLAPIMDQGVAIEARIFSRHYTADERDASVYLTLKKAASSIDVDGNVGTPSLPSSFSCHDFTQDELSRTYRHLKKARYHLNLAREQMDSKVKKDEIVNRIRAAFNRARESWLFKFAILPGSLDDKEVLIPTFCQIAPLPLLRKSTLLDERLHFLYYGAPFLPLLYDGGKAPSDAWKPETLACIDDIEHLIAYIENGAPLPPFRWETSHEYRPGQWVWELIEAAWGHQCSKHLRKVIAVEARDVTLRDPYRRIHALKKGSLMLMPSELPDDDMTTPFESRRTWFDLHPEYRQIPLVILSHRDVGSSLYYTCPCCGYPTMTTHPEYHCVYHDDDIERYEICPLCDWADDCNKDDGYDIDDKDSEGPNFGYSLREARRNFEEHGCIFSPRDGVYFDYQSDGDALSLKRKLRDAFETVVGELRQGKIYLLWCEAEVLRKLMIDHLKYRQTQAAPEAFLLRSDEEGFRIGRDFDYKWRFETFYIQPGQWGLDSIDKCSKVIWVGKSAAGYVGKTRSVMGTIRDVSLPCFLSRITEKPDDDAMRPFHIRRTWFEVHPENLRGNHCCPCCGYPTLLARHHYDDCVLCQWKDGGQDDYEAAKVCGGPNEDYSLEEARMNFEEHLTKYRPSDETWPDTKVYFVPEIQNAKRYLMAAYDRLIVEIEEGKEALIWMEIDEREKELLRTIGKIAK